MTDPRNHNNTALAIKGLSVVRGGRLVFTGLTASVNAGEMLILRGPNGSGKSTLLRMLAGLIPASEGSLSFGGVPLSEDPKAARNMVALAGHLNGMKPVLTLRQNLSHYSAVTLGQRADAATLETAANAVNLATLIDDELRYYSAGQLHRAGLAKLALGGRKIWLMDEPTVGLDAQSRKSLAAMVEQHLKTGGIVVAATHEDIGVAGATLDMAAFTPSHQPSDPWLESEAQA